MYYKISENKIIKIKNNKTSKIVLRIEPFAIEEMPLDKNEKTNFNYLSFNQVHDYDLSKLEKISKNEIIKMFKNYILNTYNNQIQKESKKIMDLEIEKSKILNTSFTFNNYAIGCIISPEKEYAVYMNNAWYEFTLDEITSKYKKDAIEEYFKVCTKDEFIDEYVSDKLLSINIKTNKLQNKILEYQRKKQELLMCNFEFLIED